MSAKDIPWAAILNPRAGNGQVARLWPSLLAELVQAGFSIRTLMTTGTGDATHQARYALSQGIQGLLVVGGDGTLSEVINGCFEKSKLLNPDTHIALLPSGTGSDFIKTAGIPKATRDALACFQMGHTQMIDVGMITLNPDKIRYFINIADVGIGGAVVDRVNHTSKVLGGFGSFLWGTLATFWDYQNQRTRIVLDHDIELQLRTSNVIVANGQYFGGGMRILPAACLDDGQFDVLVVGDMSRAEAYQNIWHVYTGSHLKHPKIKHFQARHVQIESLASPQLLDVDGEQWGETPATFEVLSSALRLVVPKS